MEVSSQAGRPTILTFLRWYVPGYKAGGPVNSVRNLVDRIGDQFSFRIVTSDRDIGDDAPYPRIKRGEWQTVGGAQVCYLAPADIRLGSMVRLMRETPHDLLYLNSFLDLQFTTLPLLAYRLAAKQKPPVILAPRGEFSEGALALKSRKKNLFIGATKLLRYHKNIIWHASSEHEAEDICRAMGFVAKDVRIAPVLPGKSGTPLVPEISRPGEPLRVVFFSRISPKKNLHGALAILKSVNIPVRFTIYGPVEDETYWKRCRQAIADLPAHIVAHYAGPLRPEDVSASLSRHDVLLFPTHGENYGHVIAEAMRCGLVLLISDQTPWKQLESEGVGWDLPLDSPGLFAARLDKLGMMSPEARLEFRKRVLRKSADSSQAITAERSNRALFQGALRPA
jgi:glycosyltransferase involved in cell wall biosynthesis